MGLHADFLELGWRAYELLPLYFVPGISSPVDLPLVAGCAGCSGRDVPFPVLGLGHMQQPEELLSSPGARRFG